MSGYLELKYPRPQIGLNPFKTWKKQWCILRPCPTRAGGVSIAVYSSESGISAGCIDIAPGSIIYKAKSRSRAHAFAIHTPEGPQKTRVLLASHTAHDMQIWINKINLLLSSGHETAPNSLTKDSYFISIISTDLSKKCGLNELDCTLTMTTRGVQLAELAPKDHKILVPWTDILDVMYKGIFSIEKNKVCSMTVDGGFEKGPGVLKFTSPSTPQLAKLLKLTLRQRRKRQFNRKLSKSDSDLHRACCQDSHADLKRSSWSSEPIPSTFVGDTKDTPNGEQSQSDVNGHGDVKATDNALKNTMFSHKLQSVAASDKNNRRSVISIASGVYEEISEIPNKITKTISGLDDIATKFQQDPTDGARVISKENKNNRLNKSEDGLLNDSKLFSEEPAYESVSECLFATMRRSGKRFPPPPLPPRMPLSALKLEWKSPKATEDLTLHSSLNSLPQCCSITTSTVDLKTKTLPKYDKTKNTFNVFRKRLKSDSTLTTQKNEVKDLEMKKKRFDFPQTRELFKSFKGKKNKADKTSNLKKDSESKSCEFLDDIKQVNSKRCSKSYENLNDDCDDLSLSIDCSRDVPASLSLPRDIVELFMKSQERSVGVKGEVLQEDDYMPMSPIGNLVQPVEQHYMVMSPRNDVAANKVVV